MIDVQPADYDIESIAPGEAVAVDWTAAMYFADRRALTRSTLCLMPHDPQAMRKWLAGEQRPDDDSKAKSLGHLEHMAMLEPDEFAARILPEPGRPEIANGNAPAGTPGRMAWQTWKSQLQTHREVKAARPESIVVSPGDAKLIVGMTQALHAHPEASAILRAPGHCEQTIVWREPTTGLLVKVRVDKLTFLRALDVFGVDLEPGPVAFDLKTTEDDRPRPFVKTCWRHGHFPQAAIYTDAVEALLGKTPRWIFGVVTQKPVEEQLHGVSVYTLTDQQLARGRELYREQLIAVMERRESNDWTPAHRRGVNTLPM